VQGTEYGNECHEQLYASLAIIAILLPIPAIAQLSNNKHGVRTSADGTFRPSRFPWQMPYTPKPKATKRREAPRLSSATRSTSSRSRQARLRTRRPADWRRSTCDPACIANISGHGACHSGCAEFCAGQHYVTRRKACLRTLGRETMPMRLQQGLRAKQTQRLNSSETHPGQAMSCHTRIPYQISRAGFPVMRCSIDARFVHKVAAFEHSKVPIRSG
jgi:hypothetical protein